MRISIDTNFPLVQRKLDALRQDVATTVTARALNRTIEQARTAMSREIRSEFNISASKVREKLQIKRASLKGGVLALRAELNSLDKAGRARSLNVVNFAARDGRSGVSVKIKRKGGRKTIRGTFIGNKGRTVFERVPSSTMQARARYGGTKHAQKIKPVQTIDVPQMFNTRRINAAVVAAMRARFPAIFERELAYALSRFSKR